MATGAKLPADSGRRRVRRLPDPGRVPPVPGGLDGEDGQLWRDLWSDPVASSWRSTDEALVVRLIGLRRRARESGPDAPLGLYAAVLALETALFLTPRARRQTVPPPAVPVAGESPRERIPARRRDRILRG